MFGFKVIKEKALISLQETMTLFQRTLEDIGWINLNLDDQTGLGFIRMGFQKMIKRVKTFYYNNPLAGHWVNLTTWFVFGEGIQKPKSTDKEIQQIIDDFWQDPDNQLSCTSYQAQASLSNKIQYEGNLFFVLFDDEEGDVRVRLLNTEEVDMIIKSQEDRLRTDFYKTKQLIRQFDFNSDRMINRGTRVVYYPDKDLLTPEEFNVPSTKLAEARIYHIKINSDINDHFGVPELFRGVDWMKAHKDMAADLATIISSLSQFAWKKKVKGGQTQINNIKALMNAKSDLTNIRKSAGSTQVENEGINLDPIKTPTGSTSIAKDGLRQMKLMVAAASGLFEHYFGDPSTGNLATAKSMELPMIKKFQARQKLFENIYNTLIQYVIDRKIEMGMLSGTVTKDEKHGRLVVETEKDRTLDIDFPPILEEDLKPLAEAMTLAKNGGLITDELAAQIFMLGANVNNVEEELEKLKQQTLVKEQKKEKEKKENAERFIKNQQQQIQARDQRIKEAIETPDKNTRLVKKTNFLTQRMNAFRKSISGNFNRFKKSLNESIRSAGTEGNIVGNIKGFDRILKKFGSDMNDSAEKFFPEAVEIGNRFMQATLRDRKIKVEETVFEKNKQKGNLKECKYKLFEIEGKGKTLLERSLNWNKEFVDNSLVPDMEEKINDTFKTAFDTRKDLVESVNETVNTFEPRLELYVGAFWTVEEEAVKEAGIGSGVEANFAGADDEENCPGCQAGVNGNPWPINDIPVPGNQECVGNCRHAIQVI